MGVKPIFQMPALSISPIRATRDNVADLLVLKLDGSLSLLTHGVLELPLSPTPPNDPARRIIALTHPIYSSVVLERANGSLLRLSLDLIARDHLVSDCLVAVSFALPANTFFVLHRKFLERWSAKKYSFILGVEFEAFQSSLLSVLGLEEDPSEVSQDEPDAWAKLAATETFEKFIEDPVLRKLQLPKRANASHWKKPVKKPHDFIGPVLHALHLVAEEKRVFLPTIEGIPRLAPLICRLAMIVRPEWADYWKRHCPDAIPVWPTAPSTGTYH